MAQSRIACIPCANAQFCVQIGEPQRGRLTPGQNGLLEVGKEECEPDETAQVRVVDAPRLTHIAIAPAQMDAMSGELGMRTLQCGDEFTVGSRPGRMLAGGCDQQCATAAKLQPALDGDDGKAIVADLSDVCWAEALPPATVGWQSKVEHHSFGMDVDMMDKGQRTLPLQYGLGHQLPQLADHQILDHWCGHTADRIAVVGLPALWRPGWT